MARGLGGLAPTAAGQGPRWVYLWADGIYSGLRAEAQKLCALVVIGVNDRGEKHFLAIEDGVRESTQSWREVLLDLKHRGLETPPKLAVGDGALGFWAALEEIYPSTWSQRCWVTRRPMCSTTCPSRSRTRPKRRCTNLDGARPSGGGEGL